MELGSDLKFNNLNNLSSLNIAQKALASQAKEKAAARDFESFFIQMSLKEMRPKGGEKSMFNAGQAEQVFYQFMDEAIAKEMAASGDNFGIADAISGQIF